MRMIFIEINNANYLSGLATKEELSCWFNKGRNYAWLSKNICRARQSHYQDIAKTENS